MAAHHAPQHAVRVRQSSLFNSFSVLIPFIIYPLKLSSSNIFFGQAAHPIIYMRVLVQRSPRLSFHRCHVSPLKADELAASTSGQLPRLTPVHGPPAAPPRVRRPGRQCSCTSVSPFNVATKAQCLQSSL